MTKADIVRLFSWQALDAQAEAAIGTLRGQALEFATTIMEKVPAGPMQEAAIHMVLSATMTANAAVAQAAIKA